MHSEPQAWKQSISDTLSRQERVSLITSIFSDRNEIEAVELLSGNDAQAFIDVVDEVSVHTFLIPKYRLPVYSQDNAFCLSFRFWGTSHNIYTGGVSVIRTEFVVANPCFRNRLRFQFATTRQRPHSAMGVSRTCGRVNIVAGGLRPRP